MESLSQKKTKMKKFFVGFLVFFNAFQDVHLEVFADCGFAGSLQTILGILIDTCQKYPVNPVNLVKEENAAILVVPLLVQETLAVFFL